MRNACLFERTNVTCQFDAMYCVDICRIPLCYHSDGGGKKPTSIDTRWTVRFESHYLYTQSQIWWRQFHSIYIEIFAVDKIPRFVYIAQRLFRHRTIHSGIAGFYRFHFRLSVQKRHKSNRFPFRMWQWFLEPCGMFYSFREEMTDGKWHQCALISAESPYNE